MHRRLERTILTEVMKRHPELLTISEMILRVASTDPEDEQTKEEIRHAIRELRQAGLVRYRDDDEVLAPTHAGLEAFDLLTA